MLYCNYCLNHLLVELATATCNQAKVVHIVTLKFAKNRPAILHIHLSDRLLLLAWKCYPILVIGISVKCHVGEPLVISII